MWAVVLACVISAACIAAALRRLYFVYEASTFDPDELLRVLRGNEGRAHAPALLDVLVKDARPEGDRDVFEALRDRSPDHTAHLVAALTELDFRFERWVRVPRVCASIASSAGFLLATWALRTALLDAPEVAEEAFRGTLEGALGAALGVVAVGAVGTVACMTAFMEARRVGKARKVATEKLIERLESVFEAQNAGDEAPAAAQSASFGTSGTPGEQNSKFE